MTARLPTIWWPHDDCGCRKAPFVGARYRRLSRDLFTGEIKGWIYYTVIAVEPLRHDRIFCRRCTFRGDDGYEFHPWVQDVLTGGYEAVANVVPLRGST